MSLYAINTKWPFGVGRADFQQAISAGIAAAFEKGAPISAACALRDVGRTATVVGLNYEGCPLTLAGLYEPWVTSGASIPTWASRFVWAYDDAIGKLGAFDAQMPHGYRPTCLHIED